MTVNQWLLIAEALSAVGFWVWAFFKVFLLRYPCQCGAKFWFFSGFKKHIQTKHGIV